MPEPEDLPAELFGEEHDSVLVACPTYSGLASCLDDYLAAYAGVRLDAPDLMLVDNTDDDGEYARSISAKVEAVGGYVKRIEPSEDWEDTFYRAWGVILPHALWNGYTWVLSSSRTSSAPSL